MKMKTAVAYHKISEFIQDDVFLPVQVGAYYNSDLNIQKDSDGDNISKENPYCCEMSALYWLWKNEDTLTADYYGLCHYRRFFSFVGDKTMNKIKQYCIYYAAKLLSPFLIDARYTFFRSSGQIMSVKQLKEYLLNWEGEIHQLIDKTGVEVFCLKKTYLSTYSCQMKLEHCIGLLNFIRLTEIIRETDLNFYSYFSKTMKGNSFYPCNMVIMSKKYFNEYCRTVFTILKKYHEFIEDGLKDNCINNTALRTTGYIAEYLTSSYISYLLDKGVYVKELYCCSLEFENSGLSLGVNGSYGKRVLAILRRLNE